VRFGITLTDTPVVQHCVTDAYEASIEESLIGQNLTQCNFVRRESDMECPVTSGVLL
jgi:hypothetical protein